MRSIFVGSRELLLEVHGGTGLKIFNSRATRKTRVEHTRLFTAEWSGINSLRHSQRIARELGTEDSAIPNRIVRSRYVKQRYFKHFLGGTSLWLLESQCIRGLVPATLEMPYPCGWGRSLHAQSRSIYNQRALNVLVMDHLTPQQRSYLMSCVRTKDTPQECLVRSALH